MSSKKGQASILSFFKRVNPSVNSPDVTSPSPADSINKVVEQQDHLASASTAVKRPATEFGTPAPAKKASMLQRRTSMVICDSDDEDGNDDGNAENIASNGSILLKTPSAQFIKTPKADGNPPSAGGSLSAKIKSFASPSSQLTPRLIVGEDRKKARIEKFNQKNEAKYSFLDDIRDANGNRPGDDNYDGRTLFIPKSFWKEATPFEKQYWEIKCKHFNTVVFFKKGKFYEMFERDADIGHREFDLKLTDRAHMRMVGIPEASFDFWAAKFIAKGYRVSRVDQLETALGKEMRERDGDSKKKDDIIRRELTSIFTSGTLVDGELIGSDLGAYCISIKECVDQAAAGSIQFGVCFVDTSTAGFSICSIDDDTERTQLETLLIQMRPKEIIYEKGLLSSQTMRVLKNCVPSSASVMWNGINPVTEFWDADTTVYELDKAGYFKGEDEVTRLPQALEDISKQPLVLSAFGALVWYLRSLKLDRQLVSLGQIEEYNPIRQAGTLILDGQTLENLEIFQNSYDGTDKGTLFSLLNRCVTAFGKRLFRQWVCHPLRSADAINKRLDAVDDFTAILGVMEELSDLLKRLPDLERLISRIHAESCKLKDFLAVLDGFESLVNAIGTLGPYTANFKSARLRELIGSFPSELIMRQLESLKAGFNVDRARAENEYVVTPGTEADYDRIIDDIKQQEQELTAYLHQQRKILASNEVKYKDLGKEIYQLEVPNNAVSRVPKHWSKKSGTKAVSRYYSPELEKMIRSYQELLELRTVVLGDLYRRIQRRFAGSRSGEKVANGSGGGDDVWRRAVGILAELDCLMSLAKVSGPYGVLGDTKCRPQFVCSPPTAKGRFRVRSLRHPCLEHLDNLTAFIPNDIALGGDDKSMILLTGPNAGGKSTLLRMTCVAIIMAQLGCYVPAESCEMTLVDRIFTRIGANDNILAGQSTFMVELSETSKILHNASPQSLVILDELGRGTSTFDGYAIAYGVLKHLSDVVGCMGLFSTHYHLLTREFETSPTVRLMHMACTTTPTQDSIDDVVFLYRLIDGVANKSFGMNVAKKAGVPLDVVQKAETKAREFESAVMEKSMDNNLALIRDFRVMVQSLTAMEM